jgi:hypothetical protein
MVVSIKLPISITCWRQSPSRQWRLEFRSLSRGTDTHTALAIFACEPAGALDAMDSGKQNRIVPLSIPNTLAMALERVLGS